MDKKDFLTDLERELAQSDSEISALQNFNGNCNLLTLGGIGLAGLGLVASNLTKNPELAEVIKNLTLSCTAGITGVPMLAGVASAVKLHLDETAYEKLNGLYKYLTGKGFDLNQYNKKLSSQNTDLTRALPSPRKDIGHDR